MNRRVARKLRSAAATAVGVGVMAGLYAWYFPAVPPVWLAALIVFVAVVPLSIPDGLSAARRAGARQRRHAGKCVRCGYDLRASPGRCPECGRVPLGRRTPGVRSDGGRR